MTEENKKSAFDPLSFSHLKNPIYMTKTMCGADITSSLEVKDSIDGISCPMCKAMSEPNQEPNPADKEPNPADSEPNPADSEPNPAKIEPQPEKKFVTHYTIGIGGALCLDPDCIASTNVRDSVTCEKCNSMLKVIDRFTGTEEKPKQAGITIAIVSIPDQALSNLFGSILAEVIAK